jgi:thiamine kinase-like enzyme
LKDWAEQADTIGLLRYNQQFSSELQTYVYRNLDLYNQRSQSPLLQTLLKNWPEIARVHLSAEFFDQPEALIHGDTNFTNIHVSKSNPEMFKVVDWEWAGTGQPLADLASLLKGTPPDVEKTGLTRFIQSSSRNKQSAISREDQRTFLWCSMERGLIDAAFLSAQLLNTSHLPRVNLPDAIANSLNRVMTSYQKLSSN